MAICTNCGNETLEGAVFCDQCGAPVAVTDAAAPEPEAAPAGGSVICGACGAGNVPGEAFCDFCGSPLEAPVPTAEAVVELEAVSTEAELEIPSAPEGKPACPACGAEVLADEAFCATCGASLAEPPIPPEAVPEVEEVPAETEAEVVAEAPPEPAPAEAAVAEVEPELAPAEAAVVEGEPDLVEVTEPEPAPAPEAVPAPEPDAVPAPVLDNACPACGAEVEPGDKFCSNCGATQAAVPAPAAVAVPAPELAPTPAPEAAPAPAPSAAPRLVVVASAAEIPLATAGEILIGREDPVSGIFPEVDLTPHDGEAGGVSRRHAKMVADGGDYLVEDLDSTNYTFINKQKLNPGERQALNDGDELRCGRVALVLKTT